MSRPKFFRDPVHVQLRFEDVDLSKPPSKNSAAMISWSARQIIDCIPFQRLRFIRQNGLANLVFHGAEHIRFTHSLGVAHLAQLMYERICRNMDSEEDDEIKFCTVIAALIHDVGHGPFSHALEEILSENGVPFHHENMTLKLLLDPESPINKFIAGIDKSLPEKIAAYFEQERRKQDHWAYKIVSSQLDADRLDYLQRDALFCGIRGQGFDLERILDLLCHSEEKRIAVERGAIEAIEAYLVTLDLLYRTIYYHHTVRAATRMLLSLFKRAVTLYRGGNKAIFGENPIRALVDRGEGLSTREYASLNEVHVWSLIFEWRLSKDPILSELAVGITDRNLFKAVDVDPQKFRETQNQIEVAKKLCRDMRQTYPADAVEYLVAMDEPERTSYKIYDWKPESPDESIWLVNEMAGPGNPLENDVDSTIVHAFRAKRYFPRLIVPKEVRDALRKA